MSRTTLQVAIPYFAAALLAAGCSLDLSRPFQAAKETGGVDDASGQELGYQPRDAAGEGELPIGDGPIDLDASGGSDETGHSGDARAPDLPPVDTRPPDTRVVPDARPPDARPPGKWIQTNTKACSKVCAGLGQKNVAGPEGAHCTSGEMVSASAVAQGINFLYGCWKVCVPRKSYAATSVGGYCYGPTQSQDYDKTDRTVGCFCR